MEKTFFKIPFFQLIAKKMTDTNKKDHVRKRNRRTAEQKTGESVEKKKKKTKRNGKRRKIQEKKKQQKQERRKKKVQKTLQSSETTPKIPPFRPIHNRNHKNKPLGNFRFSI